MLPALTALRDRDLASYHAVEHKAIGGYERGSFDPADVPKEHERCGSNLIGPMLVFSIAGQVLIERLVRESGPDRRAASPRLASVGGAVELFVYAERTPIRRSGRAIHGPGYEIQRLVSTREPTAEQLEVGVGRSARGPTGRAAKLPIARPEAGSLPQDMRLLATSWVSTRTGSSSSNVLIPWAPILLLRG